MSDTVRIAGGTDAWSGCQLCLSTERALMSIEDVRWAYHVVTDTREVSSAAPRVCWECRALLRRVDALRRQAVRAAAALERAHAHIAGASTLPSVCLSRLVTATRCRPDLELVSPTCDELDRKELSSPRCEEPAVGDFARVKSDEEIVVPKVESWDADDCYVWADAAPEFEVEVPPSEPAPCATVKKKKEKRKIDMKKEKQEALTTKGKRELGVKKEKREVRVKKEKREVRVKKEKRTVRVKREPRTGEDGLEDLEGACELAWESAADALRRRAARARSSAFAARLHTCAPCALSFPTERARVEHARQLHCEGPEAVACELCACRAASAALAAEHRATHRALRCRRCRFSTRSARNMRRHVAAHARTHTRQAISCDVCGKQFMNKQHFYVHHKMHTSRQTYECDHCGRVYRTRTQMFRHLRSHRKRYLCDICGKMFSDQTYLKCHYLAHGGASERRFECARCHKRYINKFKLEVHMRFHTGEKPFRCDACDKRFREKAQLTAHNRKYHPGETAVVVKKKRKFERTKSAFVNERFVESKEPPPGNENTLDPEKKANRAKTDKALKTKIERVEYVCNFCGKKFKDKWRLKFHLAVHSDERPFKCDECELTFKYQSGLWTHKLLHKGEKPHQCTICGSQFTQKGNLTAHLKIHTDEKPFECNVCGNKFRMRRNLRNHMKVHLNMDGCKILALCE